MLDVQVELRTDENARAQQRKGLRAHVSMLGTEAFFVVFFGTEALYEMYLILSMVLISSLVQRELTRGAEQCGFGVTAARVYSD